MTDKQTKYLLIIEIFYLLSRSSSLAETWRATWPRARSRPDRPPRRAGIHQVCTQIWNRYSNRAAYLKTAFMTEDSPWHERYPNEYISTLLVQEPFWPEPRGGILPANTTMMNNGQELNDYGHVSRYEETRKGTVLWDQSVGYFGREYQLLLELMNISTRL